MAQTVQVHNSHYPITTECVIFYPSLSYSTMC